jgi:YebC/PmpR family DNA-binding regulatory protein
MSRHSHWATIKKKKTIADQKRGQIFSKLAREIEIAARSGGDPELNPKLRVAIEKAKEARMPAENIEKAIKRGTGELKGSNLQEVIFEAYGPGNVAIIIEGITDNKNRTINELKQILQKFNGKLVSEGAIKWMFERKGCISVNLKDQENVRSKEELELIAIEAGAEDFFWQDDSLDIYTKIENLNEVKKKLEEKGVKISSFSLDWVPKELISVDETTKKRCQELFEMLDENDAVQEIYFNMKI